MPNCRLGGKKVVSANSSNYLTVKVKMDKVRMHCQVKVWSWSTSIVQEDSGGCFRKCLPFPRVDFMKTWIYPMFVGEFSVLEIYKAVKIAFQHFPKWQNWHFWYSESGAQNALCMASFWAKNGEKRQKRHFWAFKSDFQSFSEA